MTYRHMWETYIEPNLKTQKKVRNQSLDNDNDKPVTTESKVAECQAYGMMFGQDPIEVGKAARKSWPITPEMIREMQAKLKARQGAAK